MRKVRWRGTRVGGLPQGAPSSPRLSNLVNYRMDARLSAVAAKLPGLSGGVPATPGIAAGRPATLTEAQLDGWDSLVHMIETQSVPHA